LQIAGVVGVDPGPLTLRELLWMHESRVRDQWNHTSSILALTANCHRDPKKTASFAPQDFHPLEKPRSVRRGQRITANNIGLLKAAFVR